ncbi:hypothetical protein J5289_21720 [Rhizobium sp. B230/85]|uniref:hypothetical protein n=1 Tax=unclassified Rhizobium TaxID=2613769 RepID=UPI001ADA8A73|nr:MULTISPECIES: hypothetical protein [unclassified Rhizobium]MBO9135152.1 hypothetical protein [Rhizobium sp. B209b/85]QXZ97943.1 hypothetical protein J5289_21720 [Rhizobium sp. B230/85]
MKTILTAQILKEEARKKRRAEHRWLQYLEDIEQRKKQYERERRRLALLLIILLIIFSAPIKPVFIRIYSAQVPLALPPSRSLKKNERHSSEFDYTLHIERDFAPRYGEENLEIMDGLTADDVAQIRRQHQPPKVKIPGMPDRYADEWPHPHTLLDHLQHDFFRADAIAALKKITPAHVHDWLDQAAIGDGWKALRLSRQKTKEETLATMPLEAARWREDLKREAEERTRDEQNPKDSDDPNGSRSPI